MNLLLLIFAGSFTWFGSCTPRKRKATNESDTDAIIAKHEREHYNDYSSKKEIYMTWPEVDVHNVAVDCKKYLSKLCFQKYPFLKSAALETVHLKYTTTNIKDSFPRVSAIRCMPSPPIFHRKIFRFIRAPDPRCVYLLHNVTSNSKIYGIALRICEIHTYKQLRDDLRDIYVPSSTRYESRKYDNSAEITEYEMEHLQDFLSNKASYEAWPELKSDIIMKQYCKVFLKKMFPNTEFNFNPTLQTSLLFYTNIRSDVNISVATLFCNPSRPARHKSQQFIKAPSLESHTCVFLITNRSRGQHQLMHYKICRKLCADEKDSINQPENDIFSELDIMIQETQSTFGPNFFEEIQNEIMQLSDHCHDKIIDNLDSIISEDHLHLP